ncbi:hypothetical protein B0H17DRAFT_1150437 [Mycena rosella]|uniref:Uncharacterized protein n=1 Tax=Mycena rosella TaxID=1033263 RepID=A0AAD7FNV5_MYCRO|nr:hypothetical protein B0H17DRAFT_1150437 [Mycena rosella]
MYNPGYIAANPGMFLDHEWIDIRSLRQHLAVPVPCASLDASSMRPIVPDPVSVKIEAPLLPVLRASAVAVKAEPEAPGLPSRSAPIKMRVPTEGGREVLELLSDSEPDASGVESDLEVVQALKPTSRSSSIIPFDFIPGSDNTESAIFGTASSSPEDFEDLDDIVESDTFCKMKSRRFDPKHDFDNIKMGEPYTLDHLIRNAVRGFLDLIAKLIPCLGQDNDSWTVRVAGATLKLLSGFSQGDH